MILHLATDEKFIDMGFRTFEEVAPNTNHLVVVTGSVKLEHVKTKPHRVVSYSDLQSPAFFNVLKNYKAVVFHSLFTTTLRVPKNLKTLWIGFGVDYYGLIYQDSDCLLLPKTQRLKVKNTTHGHLKYIVKNAPILRSLLKFRKSRRLYKQFVQRIDFFAPVLANEYQLIKEANPKFQASFLDWNYGTLEDDLLGSFGGKEVSGKNILIGNSATYTNNHLEAFDLLEVLDIDKRKVICPLSYGNNNYQEAIIQKGLERFGDNFKPLISFMSIDEYFQTLSSCSIVIMNHVRQQAVGNIILMLHLGAKVFLRSENPVYEYLKNAGAIIYSVEELTSTPSLLDENLKSEHISLNRQVLMKLWSRAVIDNKTQNVINHLIGDETCF